MTSCEVEAKDEKRAIMSDEFYMTRMNNAISTETERIAEAIQVIVNVSRKIRSTRVAFARDLKRQKMRYFKLTYTVETTTRPPIVNVRYGYQRILANNAKGKKN